MITRNHILSATCIILVSYCRINAQPSESLLNKADSLEKAANYDSAISIGKLALEHANAKLGPENAITAHILQRLGVYSDRIADYSESELLRQQALDIKVKVFGYDHPEVALSRIELANVKCKQEKYSEAEQLYLNALPIIEDAYGSGHQEVAKGLNNLAKLYIDKGKFDEAERILSRALNIWEKISNTDQLEIIYCLNYLAYIYRFNNKFSEAESLYKRALNIATKYLTHDHPEVAYILDELGMLYYRQGKYKQSESIQFQALDIRKKIFGEEHPDVASSLSNLGLVYWRTGEYSKAEKYIKNASSIDKDILGLKHTKYATDLLRLGLVNFRQGELAGAEELFIRALNIYEKIHSQDHPYIAEILNVLAVLYRSQERYAEAESIYVKALEIAKKTLGCEHPGITLVMQNMSNLYAVQGEYAKAESLMVQALAIRERALGTNHHSVATCLDAICLLSRYQNNYEKALKYSKQASLTRLENLPDIISLRSEKDALSYSRYSWYSVSNFLTCYFECKKMTDSITREAANIIFMSKGFVSDGMFERQKALIEESDTLLLALSDSIKTMKTRLSELFAKGPGNDIGDYRNNVDSLERLITRLEAQLSYNSANYKKHMDYANVSADRIASLMPSNGVLVEYLKYEYVLLREDSTSYHYLTIILDKNAKPVIIDLGDASKIDNLVKEYRRHMLYVSTSGNLVTKTDVKEYRSINAELYAAIWKPIENYIDNKRLVLIAPDGALNMISFAGLISDDNKFLIEKYSIHYLSSGRDFIRLKDPYETGNGLLAIGDPDYNASIPDRLIKSINLNDKSKSTNYHVVRNIRSGCETIDNIRLIQLPGTRQEVESIIAKWQESVSEPVYAYFGSQASEDRFKAEASGKRIIHIATHGYFLDGICQEDKAYINENPLLHSGLFFAGSNLHGEGADSASVEDGILTAYEVSAMNLEGTELVILSACETGLGAVESGEGVYGLRRAFQLSGARTVISALWAVSDQFTAEILCELYDKDLILLPYIIRNIQLEKISELRSEGKIDHPINWAGFIALGDWK